MEATIENNAVLLAGVVEETPVFSHALYGESFYRFMLCVPRLSGVEDVLPVTVSERLLEYPLTAGMQLTLGGQLRSYNMQGEGNNRLLVTVFARSLEKKQPDAPFCNKINLHGFICKPPVYRMTPFSREITDLLLAVNRPYHKSDYLPVIVWGRNARFVGALCVGGSLYVAGRVQSRTYQKVLPDGTSMPRIAYEVSASSVEWKNKPESPKIE